MIPHQKNDLSYFTFGIFDETKVDAAVFTRKGGVSPEPWNSLNVGGSVGDSQQNVIENREKLFESIGHDPSTMYDVWQVHSNEIVYVDHPRLNHAAYQKADAILTDRIGVTLFMRFADCVPILIYDPIHRAIGLIHSGWVGTVNQIVRDSICAMKGKFGSDPAQLIAGIGPSICCNHYVIGEDVAEKVNATFKGKADLLLIIKDGTIHFDLWAANKLILEQSGVKYIEVSELCTACHPEDWYSHRGEKGKTGRFGAIFSLK